MYAIKEILASQECFQNILDASSDAIFCADEGLGIILFNKRAESVFGYSCDEALGLHLNKLLPQILIEDHYKTLSPLSSADPQPIRVSCIRKNCEAFPAEITISRDKAAGRMVFTSVLQDVSAKQMAEEKLQALAQDLEGSINDLKEFACIASHDLQVPLRRIITYGDRLKEKFSVVLGDQGSDYIMRMERSALTMEVLLEDLLSYSLFNTESPPFQLVDLNKIVAEIISNMKKEISDSAGKVAFEDLPELVADPLQIRQLFQNLISNGLKFRRENEPPFVKISSREGQNNTFEILIEDNGIGFDNKHLDKIFRPFQRLHGKNQYSGTGIGLAICDKIIKRHGGEISADGRPGIGAVFSITLPRKNIKN